ncbi:hypothetical protein [Rhizobium halophytocola]|uniref:Component of type VI protein secretion system n=1 Tax=Rhizobium halophytocola TaxID=735519 RepID=A0ABS4DYB3_9HYPH|nr:hypothetical protein [Rhizobium halophytocola]MBP1850683.1 putative component of type VI protein secretion system [Rhizobium halophytocola]
MNNFSKFASATFISALAFGGESYAASMPSVVTPSQTAQQLKTTANPRVNVIRASSLSDAEDPNNFIADISPSSPQAREVQQAVRQNASLHRQLEAEHVEIQNITYAREAADGSFMIVVR